MSYNCRHSFLFMASRQVEGDRGAGARKNKGRERAGSGSRNKEGDSLLFMTEYYSVKNTYIAKF